MGYGLKNFKWEQEIGKESVKNSSLIVTSDFQLEVAGFMSSIEC